MPDRDAPARGGDARRGWRWVSLAGAVLGALAALGILGLLRGRRREAFVERWPTWPADAPTPGATPRAATQPGPSREDADEAASAGHGSDGLAALLELTREELYARARRRDVPGRSRMSKRQLAAALVALDTADDGDTTPS